MLMIQTICNNILKLTLVFSLALSAASCGELDSRTNDALEKANSLTYCSAISKELKFVVKNFPLFDERELDTIRLYADRASPTCSKTYIPTAGLGGYTLEEILNRIQKITRKKKAFFENEFDLL